MYTFPFFMWWNYILMYLHTVFSQVSLRTGIVTLHTDNTVQALGLGKWPILWYQTTRFESCWQMAAFVCKGRSGRVGTGISQLGVRTPKKRPVYVAVLLPLSEPSSHLPEEHLCSPGPEFALCNLTLIAQSLTHHLRTHQSRLQSVDTQDLAPDMSC